MRTSVAGIYDRGSIEKERVHFRADVTINLSFYVLLDTSWTTPTQVAAGNHSAFWLPPQQIDRGHHVVVYTRAGNPNVETRADGSKYHFLFRGLANPLYALPQACAVLLEVQTWMSTTAANLNLPPLPPVGPMTLGEAFEQGALGSVQIGNLLLPPDNKA